MQCVAIDNSGFVVAVAPPSDDLNLCEYILVPPSQAVSPFVLDTFSAVQISLAIMTVWAVAFGIRCLSHLIRNS